MSMVTPQRSGVRAGKEVSPASAATTSSLSVSRQGGSVASSPSPVRFSQTPPPRIVVGGGGLYGMAPKRPAVTQQAALMPKPLTTEEKYLLHMHQMNAYSVRLARRQGIAAQMFAKLEDHPYLRSCRVRWPGETLRSPRRLCRARPGGGEFVSHYDTKDLEPLKVAPELKVWGLDYPDIVPETPSRTGEDEDCITPILRRCLRPAIKVDQ